MYHRVHNGGGGDDRSNRVSGLCDAAPERAAGVRGDRAGDRSYTSFSLDHGTGRRAISSSLKLLDHLGLIEIAPGKRLVNIFRFSNRWRTIDEVEAVRLAALARELKPHRTFGKPPEPKPVQPPKPPKPMTVERPRAMQRRVPSLPTMPWQDDGR